jgi:xanthine/CO dehydrogenase XdhC/CoxF family maturation factor
MRETLDVCRALADSFGQPRWLATVVGVEGSAYRRPGARLLFSTERVLAGALSGGCLEREVLRLGPWLTSRGPVVRSFDHRLDEEAGAGSGCDGKVEVLIEPCADLLQETLAQVQHELESEHSFTLATLIESHTPALALGTRFLGNAHAEYHSRRLPELALQLSRAAALAPQPRRHRASVVSFRGLRFLLELLEPPPHLFVFGAGPDAVPLARIAGQLGWEVTVCGTDRVSTRERFSGLARYSSDLKRCVVELEACARPLAVVMSHDYERDRGTLAALLPSRCEYLGALGPARRTERLLNELAATLRVLPARGLDHLHAPAGLSLGAETAEEIALSIIADAQARLTASDGASLRDRPGDIHESTPQLQLIFAEGA